MLLTEAEVERIVGLILSAVQESYSEGQGLCGGEQIRQYLNEIGELLGTEIPEEGD